MTTVGFIGAGNMGSALASAIALADNTRVLVYDTDNARAEALVRAHLETLLADKENPRSLYEMEAGNLGLWHEPMIDCDIVSPVGTVKETAAVAYRVLWSFYREGRLRWILGPHGHLTMMKFWLE